MCRLISARSAWLMCRDPARRLSGRDAISRLDHGSVAATVFDAVAPPVEAPFVGRARELEVLDEGYLTVTRSRASAGMCGPSGIGKTALVRSFLGRLTTHEAVVVSGRCYEHESVPQGARRSCR